MCFFWSSIYRERSWCSQNCWNYPQRGPSADDGEAYGGFSSLMTSAMSVVAVRKSQPGFPVTGFSDFSQRSYFTATP